MKLIKGVGKITAFLVTCCLSKAARDHLEIKQNLQIYPIILSYMSFEGVRLQLGRKFCCHPLSPSSPLPIYISLFSFIIRDRTIRQRWSPWKRCWKIDFATFKTICDHPKSPCYLKEENFWNWKEGTAPEFRQRWYNLSPCCFRSQVQGCAGKAKKLTKKAWCTCRVAGLLIKPIAFLTFPLPLPL